MTQERLESKILATSTFAPSAPNQQQAHAAATTFTLVVLLQGAFGPTEAGPDDVRLLLTIVSEKDPAVRSQTIDLSKVRPEAYKRDDPTAAGTKLYSRLTLDAIIKPGVILLEKVPEEDPNDESPPFVATIELQPEGSVPPITYAAFTYIDVAQGERVIFPSSRALPGFSGATPKGLLHFRQKELDALRGTEADKSSERTGAERIYDYDVYNDLGNPMKPGSDRPTLGGDSLKYPRRLRTGRPLVGEPAVYESAPHGNTAKQGEQGDPLPWLPLDERFNSVKNDAFYGDKQTASGRALGSPRGIGLAAALQPFIQQMHLNNVDPTNPRDRFTNLTLVDALYNGLVGDEKDEDVFKDLAPLTRLSDEQLLDNLQAGWHKMDDALRKALGLDVSTTELKGAIAQERVKLKEQAQVQPHPQSLPVAGPGNSSGVAAIFGWLLGKQAEKPCEPAPPVAPPVDDAAAVGQNTLGQRVDEAVGLVRGLLEKWPVPNVRLKRALEWRSDEDFGRQALAGQNPLSIRALTQKDLDTFDVREAHVRGLLEGASLKDRLAEGRRLWAIDFHTGFIDYITKVAELPGTPGQKKNVLYAGRCVLYTRADGLTVPVSIELETDGQPMRVYTPNSPAEVWLLAKTVFSSMDSGYHQLVSHFLQTHACIEPYIIASRRELSAMNPVYKLLQPHFRYTMRINCAARSTLINAGGIVEQTFTPGRYSMELSSVVYNSWRFGEQALPADLLKRGVAERDRDGKLRITIPNYPYAEDGLLIWEAMECWVDKYLRLYYHDDTPGHQVTDDAEVMAWWWAVRNKGHPDIPDTEHNWPKITDVASLRDVCLSIMWTASCHHAAVNFGQYDNGGYMPYKPTMILQKIPKAGSPEEEALKNCFERELLNTISDPTTTLQILVTLTILSSHAADEEYIDKKEHSYIKEPAAVHLHKQFVEALNSAEAEMAARNQGAERLQQGRGLPYTLLMPSNPQSEVLPGTRPAGRGVPYSVSI